MQPEWIYKNFNHSFQRQRLRKKQQNRVYLEHPLKYMHLQLDKSIYRFAMDFAAIYSAW